MKHIALVLLVSLVALSCKTESESNEPSARELEERSLKENTISPDAAPENGDTTAIAIQPISHATAVIIWGQSTIYLDPTGGAAAFDGKEAPDLVLITDIHADHMDVETLQELELGETPIIAPQAVKNELPQELHEHLLVMNNGDTLSQIEIDLVAIPMYNLRQEALQFHEKGRGNGYVLQKNGTRVYIAGDTEDIPEMRSLNDIDLALIPMNLPYTMTVESAAEAVIEFGPKRVFPYHFRGTEGMADIDRFKELVNEGNPEVEVVKLNWYPDQ